MKLLLPAALIGARITCPGRFVQVKPAGSYCTLYIPLTTVMVLADVTSEQVDPFAKMPTLPVPFESVQLMLPPRFAGPSLTGARAVLHKSVVAHTLGCS